MKVEVTQKHIDDGEPIDGENCALALALREKLGFGVTVTYNGIWKSGEAATEDNGILEHTDTSLNFIERFDSRNLEVKPHKFILKELK